MEFVVAGLDDTVNGGSGEVHDLLLKYGSESVAYRAAIGRSVVTNAEGEAYSHGVKAALQRGTTEAPLACKTELQQAEESSASDGDQQSGSEDEGPQGD
jgi:hypothetical protein